MLTSGVRTSNTFESVSSISTGLERRIDYWILESFPPRMPSCSAVLFLDLGMAAEQLHAPLARQIDDVRVRPGPAMGRLAIRSAERAL